MCMFHTNTELYHETFELPVIIYIQRIDIFFVHKIITAQRIQFFTTGKQVETLEIIGAFYDRGLSTKAQSALFEVLFIVYLQTINIDISRRNHIIVAGADDILL